MSKGEPLWNKVIIGKYGVEEGGRCSLEAREGYGVGLWKAIRKEWDAFKSKISYVLGNGRRLRFWKDIWRGDTPLTFDNVEPSDQELKSLLHTTL